jgi:hypothetical protein
MLLNDKIATAFMRLFVNIIILVQVGWSISMNAQANPSLPNGVRLEFTASVTDVRGSGIQNIKINDRVSGILIYDADTLNTSSSVLAGHFPNAIKSLELSIGSESFSLLDQQGAETSEIDIENDSLLYGEYLDRIQFRAAVLEASGGPTYIWEMSFISLTESVSPWISSADKIPSDIDLAAADRSSGHVRVDPFSTTNAVYFNFDHIALSRIGRPDNKGWLVIMHYLLEQ